MPVAMIHGFGVDHRIMLPTGARRAWAVAIVGRPLPWTDRTPLGAIRSSEDVAAALRDAVRARLGDDVVRRRRHSTAACRLPARARPARPVLGPRPWRGSGPARSTRACCRSAPCSARTWSFRDVDPVVAAGYRAMAAVEVAGGPGRVPPLAAGRGRGGPGERSTRCAPGTRLRRRARGRASPEPFTAPTPALCASGPRGRACGRVAAARPLPARVVRVPDAAGHNVHLDQPRATAAALAARGSTRSPRSRARVRRWSWPAWIPRSSLPTALSCPGASVVEACAATRPGSRRGELGLVGRGQVVAWRSSRPGRCP